MSAENIYGGTKGTHGRLSLLLLGLLLAIDSGSGLRLGGFAVGLFLSDLAWDSLGTTSARSSLCLALSLFLVLLIGRLSDLDDDLTTIELGLVQELDGFVGSRLGGKGNKSIASRAGTPQNDLN